MANANEKIPQVGALKRVVEQLKGKFPTNVSELTNDSGFQTAEQVAAAVAAADHLTRKKVGSVSAIDPAADGADKFIYMVPKASSDEDDLYDEYMVLDGKVEHVGNTKIDLSGYDTAEQTAAKLEGKVDKVEGKGLSSNDFSDSDKAKLDGMEIATDEEVDAMLAEVFGA